ncbi:family 43 glycosylhydrolase [Lacibacter sp.]|uniref:family 43 glycosylhydrolase n=1 Tax=Lacibacter sp. TaxID=1915409 RepID=UPI002B4AEEFD|nr:family 43 glycosylhydrolase [Lacibacter sp.]HLP37695.1 family 43 glycosylhydrolase [Lacibacter sp.]
MKKTFLYIILLLNAVTVSAQNREAVPAPLFSDPNYYGSCDPEIIYNPADKYYYIYYTSRRATIENLFTATPVGVIKSKDLMNWKFVGYCKFDGIGGTKDMPATFWAPAIIADKNELHMFVTWKPDTTTAKGPWGGPAKIVHYKTALNNPVNGWIKVADMHDSTYNSLDATVYKKNDTVHVWFKGKKAGEKKNELFHVVSTDMKNWKASGFSKSDVFNEAATGQPFEEAPYIFQWKNKYYMLTDPHKGLMVYESSDSENWKYQGIILKDSGTRKLDNSRARHCSVIVKDNRAFIFYHVEPWRDYDSGIGIPKQPISNRRAVLQMAELKIKAGKISCNRNEAIKIN